MIFDGIYESWPLKVSLIVACLLLLVIGNALWFGIIHFEKFGGDPQKRSLANILSSFASIGCSVLLTSTVGIHLARVIFGCSLPDAFAYIMVFIRRLGNTFVFTCIVEILLYKMIQVYRFRIVAGLNDDFWGLFLLMATIMHSLIINVSMSMLDKMANPVLDLLACYDNEAEENKFVARISLAAAGVCLFQIIMTLGKKLYEINKDRQAANITLGSSPAPAAGHVQAWPAANAEQPAQQPLFFNNQRWNQALATSGQYVLILILYVGGAATQLTVPMEMVIEYPWLTVPRHFTLPFINGILVPVLFYMSNKAARKHVKELYGLE